MRIVTRAEGAVADDDPDLLRLLAAYLEAFK